jgi:hypothetical protein
MRVFVHWNKSTVFAGEDIECTITFKNVALPEGSDRSPIPTRHQNGFAPSGERLRKLPPVHSSTRPSISRKSSFASQGPPQPLRAHRPAQSLHTFNNNGSTPSRGGKHAHGKSLSIVSLGTDAATEVSQERAALRRPMRGHGRSASLQVMPGRPSPLGSPGQRSLPQHSPLAAGLPTPPIINERSADYSLPTRPFRRQSSTSTAPNSHGPPAMSRKKSNSSVQNFRFPAAPPSDLSFTFPKPDDTPTADTLSPVARVLSGSSMNGTPRSSGEFYSMSNNSNETLASEYTAQPSARLLPRAVHQRRASQLASPVQRKHPETLMMGYAQIMGSFTLDGSLINQAPFEEVKRKGVVGGQGGGGVVGVERTKRESGLFGALGWSNIGESLGGLLGSSEPSSIREMRGIASSKTVPLITTPQSILFVDLQLAPGESRSYTYSFTLPRGLPPTHKGRSIKTSYHLTIGTQRPSSSKDQHVKHVDVPFRVFGSVNSMCRLQSSHHPYH